MSSLRLPGPGGWGVGEVSGEAESSAPCPLCLLRALLSSSHGPGPRLYGVQHPALGLPRASLSPLLTPPGWPGLNTILTSGQQDMRRDVGSHFLPKPGCSHVDWQLQLALGTRGAWGTPGACPPVTPAWLRDPCMSPVSPPTAQSP